MKDFTPASPPEDSDQPPGLRLSSWKEIATYVKRDVSTVQRWEKREAMPVHRHLHDKRGSVYAFTSELDAWMQTRGVFAVQEEGQQPDTPVESYVQKQEGAVEGRSRWAILLIVAAVLSVLILVYAVVRNNRAAAPPVIKSIAVLPLQNLSGDPAQEYLADGMTEALIGRLSGIRSLRVISRTSMMRFKGTKLLLPEIARTLKVDAVVEGSVIRENNRIRVTAQLIRAATDEHVWSETYDRETSDALALQSELAQAIARKVEATVTGDERKALTAVRSVSPEVYETYLKGRFGKKNSRADFEASVANFEEATRRDPTFAPAYVGLAEAYNSLGAVFVGRRPSDVRPQVLNAARKALELDPRLAEAHVLIADVEQKQWQWSEAEAEYKIALDLDPNNADAHLGLAHWLLANGRTEEALNWAYRGRELDPLGISGIRIGWILFQARRYDDAERELRSALAVQPDDANALWFLGFVLTATEKPKEAIPVLEKALSKSERSPGVIGVLIRAYSHAGRETDANRLLDELKRRQKNDYVPAGAFVNAYLGLGDNEQALAWLTRAYDEQSNILQYLKVHPFFDPLRGDRRFTQLVRSVGLQ